MQVNNRILHRVFNQSPDITRVQLVVDVAEEDKPLMELKKGAGSVPHLHFPCVLPISYTCDQYAANVGVCTSVGAAHGRACPVLSALLHWCSPHMPCGCCRRGVQLRQGHH